jgi:hypothetical protein
MWLCSKHGCWTRRAWPCLRCQNEEARAEQEARAAAQKARGAEKAKVGEAGETSTTKKKTRKKQQQRRKGKRKGRGKGKRKVGGPKAQDEKPKGEVTNGKKVKGIEG